MEFDRVRNDEQRKIRVEQIKNAAIKLFDEKPYHEITLADIAGETNFTRGNLYKYIASKEEIFLLVVTDEVRSWIFDLNSEINGSNANDVEWFSQKWSTITFRHTRFLKLLAILLTILEKNVALEKLIAFKNEFATLMPIAYIAIGSVFPAWSPRSIDKFIELQKNYAVGLFPTTTPTPIQLEATQKSHLNYQFPDFVESFTEFICYTVHYINSESTLDK